MDRKFLVCVCEGSSNESHRNILIRLFMNKPSLAHRYTVYASCMIMKSIHTLLFEFGKQWTKMSSLDY